MAVPPDQAASAGPPAAHEVAVWLLRLPEQSSTAARLSHVLDQKESRRAAAFQEPVARERYVTSHVGLRLVLGAYLRMAPQQVEFARDECGMAGCCRPHGRPVLVGSPGLHFSLSHAGDMALYALSGSPVGADIESEGVVRDSVERTARRLHPRERRAVAALPPTARPAALLGCLVRKEAYLKGIGTGLAAGLGTHHVGLAGQPAPAADRQEPAGWSLCDVPAPETYQAAVAVRWTSAAGDGPVLRVGQLRLG